MQLLSSKKSIMFFLRDLSMTIVEKDKEQQYRKGSDPFQLNSQIKLDSQRTWT
jgi:hypothetical protein